MIWIGERARARRATASATVSRPWAPTRSRSRPLGSDSESLPVSAPLPGWTYPRRCRDGPAAGRPANVLNQVQKARLGLRAVPMTETRMAGKPGRAGDRPGPVTVRPRAAGSWFKLKRHRSPHLTKLRTSRSPGPAVLILSLSGWRGPGGSESLAGIRRFGVELQVFAESGNFAKT